MPPYEAVNGMFVDKLNFFGFRNLSAVAVSKLVLNSHKMRFN